MVNVSFDWELLKMPFILLALLISLRGFKGKRKSSYEFMFPKGKS